MKQILIAMILLFSLSGCQDAKEKQAQHDAQVAQKAKEELLAELKEEARKKELEAKKNSKLSKIGITTEDGKIIIDTNKTKDFFKEMATKMEDKMERLSKDLEKGIIKDKNAGIEVDEAHIHIDLNKTKIFLDTWGKKMQEFVKEFEDIAKEFADQNKTIKDTNATDRHELR